MGRRSVFITLIWLLIAVHATMFDQNRLGLLLIPLPQIEEGETTIPQDCRESVDIVRGCQHVLSSSIKLQAYAKYGDSRFRALCV